MEEFVINILEKTKSIRIVIGSGTIGGLNTLERITHHIDELVKHNFIDWEFFFNWTDNRETYIEHFNKYMLPSILSRYKDFIIFEKDTIKINPNIDTETARDLLIMNNKLLPNNIKKEYADYRKEYAGVELSLN